MGSGAPCRRSNCNRCKTTASTTRTTTTSTTRETTTAMCNSNKYWQPLRMPIMDSNSQLVLSSQQRCTTFARVAAKLNSPYPCSRTVGRQAGQETCPSSTTLRATTHCEYTNNKDNNKTTVISIQQQLTMPTR